MSNCVGSDIASKDYKAISERIVGSHEMAQRSIAASDKAMREQLRANYLTSLSPEQRINLGRNQNAHSIIEVEVDALMEQKIQGRLS